MINSVQNNVLIIVCSTGNIKAREAIPQSAWAFWETPVTIGDCRILINLSKAWLLPGGGVGNAWIRLMQTLLN